MNLIKIRIGKKTFVIKDCKGLSSIRGLMFDDLKNYDGAMIYANSIWMPFVKYNLKLIFVDDKMKVLSSEIANPISFNPVTWRIYENKKARYCLELKDIKTRINKDIEVKFLGSVV